MKYFKMILILLGTALILIGCTEVELLLESPYKDETQKNEIIELIKTEKYDEAFERVEKILKQNEYNSIEMNEIAYNFLDKNQGEEGIYILQILHNKHPEVDGFRNNLCWGYLLIGEYKIANYYGDLALEIEPNEAIEYSNKGNALFGLDKYDEALKFYETGYAIDKNEKLILWGMGNCFYELERYEEAIVSFREYAKLDPAEEKSTRYYISNSLRELEKYEDAISENRVYFQKDREDTTPLYTIASIYNENLNDFDFALKYYKLIVEINPEDAWGYLDIAACLAEEGNVKEACQYIKTAIEIDQDILYELSYYESFDKLKSLSEYKDLFR